MAANLTVVLVSYRDNSVLYFGPKNGGPAPSNVQKVQIDGVHGRAPFLSKVKELCLGVVANAKATVENEDELHGACKRAIDEISEHGSASITINTLSWSRDLVVTEMMLQETIEEELTWLLEDINSVVHKAYKDKNRAFRTYTLILTGYALPGACAFLESHLRQGPVQYTECVSVADMDGMIRERFWNSKEPVDAAVLVCQVICGEPLDWNEFLLRTDPKPLAKYVALEFNNQFIKFLGEHSLRDVWSDALVQLTSFTKRACEVLSNGQGVFSNFLVAEMNKVKWPQLCHLNLLHRLLDNDYMDVKLRKYYNALVEDLPASFIHHHAQLVFLTTCSSTVLHPQMISIKNALALICPPPTPSEPPSASGASSALQDASGSATASSLITPRANNRTMQRSVSMSSLPIVGRGFGSTTNLSTIDYSPPSKQNY